MFRKAYMSAGVMFSGPQELRQTEEGELNLVTTEDDTHRLARGPSAEIGRVDLWQHNKKGEATQVKKSTRTWSLSK